MNTTAPFTDIPMGKPAPSLAFVTTHWSVVVTAGRNDTTCARDALARLTQRQVGALLGLDYWETEAFLNDRAISLNYATADLVADRVTLEKILARS